MDCVRYRYSLSNCLFAATYDQILEQCDCVPFFHTMAFEDYPRICSGPSLLCMNKVLRDIGSHTHVKVTDDYGKVSEQLRACRYAHLLQIYIRCQWYTTSSFHVLLLLAGDDIFCFFPRIQRSSDYDRRLWRYQALLHMCVEGQACPCDSLGGT